MWTLQLGRSNLPKPIKEKKQWFQSTIDGIYSWLFQATIPEFRGRFKGFGRKYLSHKE
jgi:hypothetical protein